jgi:hypothetical protein
VTRCFPPAGDGIVSIVTPDVCQRTDSRTPAGDNSAGAFSAQTEAKEERHGTNIISIANIS